MAESPRGQGWPPCAEASWGPVRAAPKRAPYYWRRCFYTATWGAAKRRPKSLCQSALAQGKAPVSGRL
eukprot:10306280-Alexandrium_andersonii.AAC.1